MSAHIGQNVLARFLERTTDYLADKSDQERIFVYARGLQPGPHTNPSLGRVHVILLGSGGDILASRSLPGGFKHAGTRGLALTKRSLKGARHLLFFQYTSPILDGRICRAATEVLRRRIGAIRRRRLRILEYMFVGRSSYVSLLARGLVP